MTLAALNLAKMGFERSLAKNITIRRTFFMHNLRIYVSQAIKLLFLDIRGKIFTIFLPPKRLKC